MKARTVTAYWSRLAYRFFGWRSSSSRGWSWGDAVALVTVTVLIYTGVRLAFEAPAVIRGPEISLSPQYLVLYALLSFSRMLAAYAISLLFTIAYGYVAAYNQRAGKFMAPLLDVLQSVPILSFLPIVLLGLAAILPETIAAELASVVLIFTSQVWNLTFSWYQSLKTIPNELREASAVFSFDRWLRFKTLELPFAALGLIWNSIMSWAGGWFFLMAAEIFTVGQRDFRLPGIGAYLSEAARLGDLSAIGEGLIVLVAMIALLDQVVWRPLLVWSERFKLETVGGGEAPSSWFLGAWRRSQVIAPAVRRVLGTLALGVDRMMGRLLAIAPAGENAPTRLRWSSIVPAIIGGGVLLYGSYRTMAMLLELPGAQWGTIALGLLATGARVVAAVLIALAWTIPLGVAIGTKPRISAWLQPLVQIAAAVPATALFPVLLLGLLRLPAGLNIAAIVLMLMGTQWYLLFNVIAGASAVPQDLKYTTALLRLSQWQRWRVLMLPALFPYIITGLITAAGGAWNASIVAEYTQFGGSVRSVTGIGSTISIATARGDYPLLLAATLSMVFLVVAINRAVWRPLYRLAEERYRLE